MVYILHIDTSAASSTVAICRSGEIAALVTNTEVRNHAAAINNMIAVAVETAGITLKDLSAVAVCSGPGSYTGLRIAMATAKGICYATDIPLITMDRLSLLAFAADSRHSDSDCIVSVLVAREQEYFMAIYDKESNVIIAPTHITEEKMAEMLCGKEKLHIITDVSAEIFYKLKVIFLSIEHNITLDYHFWAKFALMQYSNQHFTNISGATPLYLKQVYTHK